MSVACHEKFCSRSVKARLKEFDKRAQLGDGVVNSSVSESRIVLVQMKVRENSLRLTTLSEAWVLERISHLTSPMNCWRAGES